MRTSSPATGYQSSEECEAAFYDAFRAGDVAAMQRIWSMDAASFCIHPARRPLIGPQAVMQSWGSILDGSGGLEVRFDCQRRIVNGSLAVHMGIEIIGATGDEPSFVAVTNVYALTPEGWRMRGHHAGPIHRVHNRRAPAARGATTH
jgi:ketosteroid isomerase-like protein